MGPKCAVTVAMRALLVVKGEYLRQVARLWMADSIKSGVVGGRQGVCPSAMNCGIGRDMGRV